MADARHFIHSSIIHWLSEMDQIRILAFSISALARFEFQPGLSDFQAENGYSHIQGLVHFGRLVDLAWWGFDPKGSMQNKFQCPPLSQERYSLNGFSKVISPTNPST